MFLVQTLLKFREKQLYFITTYYVDGENRFMFGGINHSLSILVSSSLYENSFTAQRIKQVQNNPHSYIIDARVWEVKPKGTYSDVMFPVFLGNDQIDPFIVNTAAELNTVLNTLGLRVYK